MATRIAVEVSPPDVVGDKHVTTCTCTCGWTLTTSASTGAMSTRIADKARTNHLDDAHPRRPPARTTTGAGAPQVVRGPNGHTPYVGVAVKEGILWTRSLTCQCGWESAASERTPYTAENRLRSEHRAHLDETTDRTPRRDYLVLLGLLAVVAIILIAMTTTAIDVSSVTGR